MPISFFEGVPVDQRDALKQRNMERRFYALAAAVREHEADSRRASQGSVRTGPAAARDERLYRRLRQLCGEPSSEEPAA